VRLFYISFVGVFLISAALCWCALVLFYGQLPSGVNEGVSIYMGNARIPMFTAFLTLGSFLLTLQTAIIQRLKDAYDNEDYKNRYLNLVHQGDDEPYYGSLNRLSKALSLNVILALCASGAQMTLGFVQSVWSTSICVALGATALILVIFLTAQMMMAHNEWFVKIEKEKKRQLQAEKEKAEKERQQSDAGANISSQR
jgi:hypothetical protein